MLYLGVIGKRLNVVRCNGGAGLELGKQVYFWIVLGLSDEGSSSNLRESCRKMERHKTTKEDLGFGLEAHGEMSRHCNISV